MATTTERGAPTTNDPAAHALLRGAHEATYHFAPDFGGFRAALELSHDAGAAAGTVEVRSPREIALAVAADEEALAWARQELGSLVGHRWDAPYEAGDGRYTQTLGPDDGHPYGQLVRLHDDRFASSYRVRDGQIAQVNRRMGAMRFTIHIQERRAAGANRTLPTHFTVTYWDAERGRLVRGDTYRDRYVEVDGVPLPASRLVVTASDDGLAYRRLELTGHELLAGQGGATAPAEAVAPTHGRTRAG